MLIFGIIAAIGVLLLVLDATNLIAIDITLVGLTGLAYIEAFVTG